MAKKKTLKSLLGGSDGRVQASLDLAKKPLRPTIQQGGQSYTAVQETQKASQSQLGMLADSLSKLNPALQSLHKGYMAETEMQKMEFAETFQGLSDEERTTLINEKQTALKNTEKNINSQLRGQYGLNPLASIYAEKLVGGAASTEFSKYSLSAIEDYKKQIEELPIDQRPDEAAYRAWADNLVNEFNAQGGMDGGELFEKGSLRHRGLLASTKDLREKLSLELPKTFSDHHKDTVYIPSLVSNLRAASTDATITKEARLEKITTFLNYLEPLDVADTKKVMTQLTESFKAEDADFARTALTEIARITTIGTEKMIGSVLMDELLEKIDDTERAYEREKIDEEIIQLNKFKDTMTPEFDAIYNGQTDENGVVIEGTGGVDETQNYIDGKIKEVSNDESLSPSLKRDYIAFLEAEHRNVPIKMDTIIKDINDFVDKSEVSTEANTGMRIVETLLLTEIEGLRDSFPDVSKQNSPFYNQPQNERQLLEQHLDPEVLRMIGEERTTYHQGYQNLLERATQLGYKTRQERGTWVMEQLNAKGGLADKFKENLKVKLKAFASEKLQKQEEIKAEDERVKAVADEATNALDKITENKLPFRKKGSGNPRNKTKEDELVVRPKGFIGGKPLETPEDYTSDLIEQYNNSSLFVQSEAGDINRSELLPDAYSKITEVVEENIGGLRANAMDLAGSRTGSQKRRKTQEAYETDVTQYQNAKAFLGYTAKEVADIIESGNVEGSLYASDAVGIRYNKDYFQNSYKAVKINGLADTPEDAARLAKLLGITPEELNKSQEDYRKKYFIK